MVLGYVVFDKWVFAGQVTETGIMMGAVGLSDRTVAFKVQRWIDPSLTGYQLCHTTYI